MNTPLSKGIFAPIPTPFKSDESISFSALEKNFEKWAALPLDGYLLGGSNGEFVFLSVEERIEVVKRARNFIARDRLLIAGAAAESTRHTAEIVSSMADAGADAVMIVTPHYFKNQMDRFALEAHYLYVAEASSVPVILYSVPANTGIDLPVEAVAALAEHPNIRGIKDSGGDVTKIGRMVERTPADFQVLAGSAGFFLGALSVGAVGAVSALANIAADELSDLKSHFDKGEMEAARDLQLRLIEPNRAVTAKYGVAGLKAAMDLMGFYGGVVRSPLQPLTEAQNADLEQTLRTATLL